MKKKFILILGIILNCTTALPALAQTCSVNTTDVAFGNYDVFNSADKTTTGTITYTCTSTGAISIALSKGNSGSYTPRKLTTSGNNYLNYNLYLDAGGTEIWGDGTNSTTQYTSSNLTGTIPIYGIIPKTQNVSVGSYGDSITATINF